MKINVEASRALQEEEERRKHPRDPRPPKILAAARDGAWTMLDHQGELIVQLQNEGPVQDAIGPCPLNGIVVWEGRMEAVGPSDSLFGGFEYEPVGEWRIATDKEWRALCDGEFVWDVWHPEEEDWRRRSDEMP